MLWLAKYAGRLHRLHASEGDGLIYDYVDENEPMPSGVRRTEVLDTEPFKVRNLISGLGPRHLPSPIT